MTLYHVLYVSFNAQSLQGKLNLLVSLCPVAHACHPTVELFAATAADRSEQHLEDVADVVAL